MRYFSECIFTTIVVLFFVSCEEIEVPGKQSFGQGAHIRVINAYTDLNTNLSSFIPPDFGKGEVALYPVVFYIDGLINTIADSVSTYPTDQYGYPYLANALVNYNGEINKFSSFNGELDKSILGGATPYIWERNIKIFITAESFGSGLVDAAAYFPTQSHRVEVGPVHNGIDWYKYARVVPGKHRFTFRPTQNRQVFEVVTLPSGGQQTVVTNTLSEAKSVIQDTIIDLASGSASVLLLDPNGRLRVIPEPVDRVFKPNHAYLRLINITPVLPPERPEYNINYNNAATESIDVYLTRAADYLAPEQPEELVALDLRRNSRQGEEDFFEIDMTGLLQSYNAIDTIENSSTFQQVVRYFRSKEYMRLKFYPSGQSGATGALPIHTLGEELIFNRDTFIFTDSRRGAAASLFYQVDNSKQGWQPTITTILFSIRPALRFYPSYIEAILYNLEPANSLNAYR
jgi:hypothetical protein